MIVIIIIYTILIDLLVLIKEKKEYYYIIWFSKSYNILYELCSGQAANNSKNPKIIGL